MARTDTLTNFLTDIAESIRAKEGTTEQIAASEFDTRIANLLSGGSSEYNSKMLSVATPSYSEADGEWFNPFTLIVELPNDFDISQLTILELGYPNLAKLPDNLDTSKLTRFSLYGASSIISIPQLDFSSLTSVQIMFADCTSLVDVPVLDFSNVTVDNVDMNTYMNCPNLSDDSLNNILASLNTLSFITIVDEVGRRLSVFGLSEEQANKCITLSNWSTLESNGWTTGY